MKDFFVSYNKVDRPWAEWIAWRLESSGYSTVVQEWDFRPGGNFALLMDRATREASQTVAVLSPDYLSSHFTQPEWAAAFANDPTGEKRQLLPIRVRNCDTEGLLPQIICVDLVGLDESTAAAKLIAGVAAGRLKPKIPPSYPGPQKLDPPAVPYPTASSSHPSVDIDPLLPKTAMARSSLVQPNDLHVTFQNRNGLATHFSRDLHSAFGDQILPRTGKFPPSQAPLYISRREGLLSEDGPSTYELHLDRLFWNDDVKMIFLQADVGSGKSTFIDYYLRSYCPNHQSRSYDFRKKLIITVDLRSVSTPNSLEDICYSAIRQEVSSYMANEGVDLVSHDCFAMWDPLFDWNSSLHLHASEGSPVEVYRSKFLAEHLASITDKQFAIHALRYLSRLNQSDRENPGPTYTVLCLHNLDQSSFDVLRHAIVLVRQWLKLGASLYKVFIPLWEETLAALTEQLSPLPRYCKTVRLGRVDMPRLVSTRLQHLGNRVRNSTPIPDAKGEESGEDYSGYLKWLQDAASGQLGKMVCDICGNSARLTLSLWENAIESRLLFEYYERQKTGLRVLPRKAATYYFLHALLTGADSYHDRKRHPVGNLFWTTNTASSPWQLLAGFHILVLLSRGVTTRRRIEDTLVQFGYRSVDIIDAVEYFRTKWILVWMSKDERDTLVANDRIVQAYLSILVQSAYVDVMGMVTPVDRSVPPKMRGATLLDSKAILERSKAGLTLIEQIHRDESAVCRFVGSQAPGVVADEFRLTRLPNVTKALAAKYVDHLSVIGSTGDIGLSLNLEWRELLDHSLLQNATTLPDALRPA